MDCIILTGGLGTRLRNKVSNLPKSLAPICGVPFLKILLKQIEKWHLVHRVIFSIGYKAEYIQKFILSSQLPFDCLFSIENTPLGTGGAILKAMPKIQSSTFIAMNGDSYFDICINSLLRQHTSMSADLTIACLKIQDSSRYGSIEYSNEYKIKSFHEKGSNTSPCINGGIYCFEKEKFLSIPFQGNFSLEREVFPFFTHFNTYAYLSSETFIDIGTSQSYAQAQKILKPLVKT